MRTLFDIAAIAEIRNRIARLGPRNERQWGQMNLAQTRAHCSGVLVRTVMTSPWWTAPVTDFG